MSKKTMAYVMLVVMLYSITMAGLAAYLFVEVLHVSVWAYICFVLYYVTVEKTSQVVGYHLAKVLSKSDKRK